MEQFYEEQFSESAPEVLMLLEEPEALELEDTLLSSTLVVLVNCDLLIGMLYHSKGDISGNISVLGREADDEGLRKEALHSIERIASQCNVLNTHLSVSRLTFLLNALQDENPEVGILDAFQ